MTAQRSFGARLAITLLVPAGLWLAIHSMLLPGSGDVLLFASGMGVSVGQDAMRAMRAFSLGVAPFLIAYGSVELVVALVPRWSRLRADAAGRERLYRVACALAIVIAATQAFGVAVARESLAAHGLPVAVGFKERLITMASLLGAFCVEVLLADIITRQGILNGYLAVFVMESLDAMFASTFGPLFADVRIGALAPWAVASTLLGIAVAAAATWFAVSKSIEVRDAKGRAAGPYRAGRSPAAVSAIPIPASSIAPYALAVALFAVLLKVDPSSMRGLFDALARFGSFGWLMCAFALSAVIAIGLARVIHSPRNLGEVARRLGGDLDREAGGAVARATPPTLFYFGALSASGALMVASKVDPTWVLVVAIAAAFALDVFRALVNAGEVVVWREVRAPAVPALRALLEGAQIRHSVRGAAVQSLLQVFGPYAPAEIAVAQADAERAAKVLREALEAPAAPGRSAEEPADEAASVGGDVEPRPKRGGVVWPLLGLALLGVAGAQLFSYWATVAKPASPPVTFELVRVDDEDDPLLGIPEARVPASEGITIEPERNLGAHGGVTRYYAKIVRHPGEPISETIARLHRFTDTVKLEPGRRFGFEPGSERGATGVGAKEPTLVRTYLLTGEPVLTAADVVAAEPQVGPGGASVRITLSQEGARRFADATGTWSQRRMALVVDGAIVSAPFVEGRIPGGKLSLPIGGDSPADVDRARALAASLAP